MSTCRSCGAAIIWAFTTTGKRMPVDAEPTDGGNVLLHPDAVAGHDPVATVVGKHVQPSIFGDDGPRYVSHFSTCAHADDHRRTR